MPHFIPVILLTAILFACNTDSKNEGEDTSKESTAVIVAQYSDKEAVAVATSNRLMEEEKEEMGAEEITAESIPEKSTLVEKIQEKEASKVEEKVESKVKTKSKIEKKETKPEAKIETSSLEQKPAPKAEKEVEEKEAKPVPKAEETKEETPKKTIPTHENWDQLVRKYVNSTGKVNYKGFKSEVGKLDAYLKELADNSPESDWKRNEAMAYWINAYNANTIKLIVDNYPVKSIMDLYGGKAFDRKWIKIGDKTYSLNNIENDILRPRYKDARIHFAVNCAAKSCPPIHNRAWTAANLSSTLQQKAKAFVNNTQYNSIEKGAIEISKIFEWYAVDFGDITTYLNKYANTEIKNNAKVSYKEYNWALNE